MKIYLIRHATPDWSRTDLAYYLPPGPSLVEQGCKEAQALGNFLRITGVRRLFTSPLERCKATAEIASGNGYLAVHVEEGLIEWQPGEGKVMVTSRMRAVFDQACRKSEMDGPAGLLSHGGPIAMLLLALGMDEMTLERQRRFDHGNPLPPAGVWEARWDEEMWRLSLVFMPGEAVSI